MFYFKLTLQICVIGIDYLVELVIQHGSAQNSMVMCSAICNDIYLKTDKDLSHFLFFLLFGRDLVCDPMLKKRNREKEFRQFNLVPNMPYSVTPIALAS